MFSKSRGRPSCDTLFTFFLFWRHWNCIASKKKLARNRASPLLIAPTSIAREEDSRAEHVQARAIASVDQRPPYGIARREKGPVVREEIAATFLRSSRVGMKQRACSLRRGLANGVDAYADGTRWMTNGQLMAFHRVR